MNAIGPGLLVATLAMPLIMLAVRLSRKLRRHALALQWLAPLPALTRLHQLRGLGDAKLLKSLGCSFKGRHYRG